MILEDRRQIELFLGLPAAASQDGAERWKKHVSIIIKSTHLSVSQLKRKLIQIRFFYKIAFFFWAAWIVFKFSGILRLK